MLKLKKPFAALLALSTLCGAASADGTKTNGTGAWATSHANATAYGGHANATGGVANVTVNGGSGALIHGGSGLVQLGVSLSAPPAAAPMGYGPVTAVPVTPLPPTSRACADFGDSDRIGFFRIGSTSIPSGLAAALRANAGAQIVVCRCPIAGYERLSADRQAALEAFSAKHDLGLRVSNGGVTPLKVAAAGRNDNIPVFVVRTARTASK